MFEHLKKLEVRDAMSWFDLPEIGEGARLRIKPAAESNAQYYNALIRGVGAGNNRRKAKQITAEDLQKHRNLDRKLYPNYVIVGWENVKDAEGESVEFSREVARELCDSLPDWLFDSLRNHASQPENFLPEGEELPSAEDIAGN
jgi:hypothetical protein